MSKFANDDPRNWRGRLEAARLICQQSLIDLFPKVKPIRSGVDGLLFFVDCVAQEPFTTSMLKMLQERVDGSVRADKPISRLEMLKANVIEYLKSQGFRERAWWLSVSVSDGVVPLLRLDNTVQEFFEVAPKSTKEAQEVEILQSVPFQFQMEGRSHSAIRIFGSAFTDNDSAKLYRKSFLESLKRSSAAYTIKKGWVAPFTDEGECNLAWLPQGLDLKESLVKRYFEEVEELGYRRVKTPAVLPKGVAEECANILPPQVLWHKRLYDIASKGEWRGCEVSFSYAEVSSRDLLDPYSTAWPLHDLNFAFMTEQALEHELISSLQFMKRTFKMLKVKCEWRLPQSQASPILPKGEWSRLIRLMEKVLKEVQITPIEGAQVAYTPQIEGRFVDALGRRWPGPLLSLITRPLVDKLEGRKRNEQEPLMGLYWTMFRSLERWLPLLEESGSAEL